MRRLIGGGALSGEALFKKFPKRESNEIHPLRTKRYCNTGE